MHEEAYRIARELDEPVEVADTMSRLAATLASARKTYAAAQLLSCSETLHEEVGVRRSWVLQRNDETLALIRSEIDDAEFAAAWEQGRSLTGDEAVALAVGSLESA